MPPATQKIPQDVLNPQPKNPEIFEENFAAFTADGTPEMAFFNLLDTDLPTQLILKGVVTTEGIHYSEEYKNYTIGLDLLEKADLDRLAEIEETLFAQTVTSPDEYDLVSFLKNGKIYLKLKEKGGKFTFTTNLKKLLPKKYAEAPIQRDQKLTVRVDATLYVNYKDKKSGLFLTVRDIFDGIKSE